MACGIIQDQIMDFHFGILSSDFRDDMERHLMGCPACLESFFSVKRDVELGRLTSDEPSKAIKLRLFDEFPRVNIRKINREKSWQRPVLVAGLAAAAIIIIVISIEAPFSPLNREDPIDQSLKGIEETIDSGRSSPSHLNIL